MSSELDATLPWTFPGAAAAIDGSPYAIGVIISKKLGCPIISISYDGPDMANNIAKANAAGSYIVHACNRLKP